MVGIGGKKKMKRSEMLTEIIFWLEQTDHLNLPTTLGSDFKKAAEELLCRIEKLGMLPPKACIERSVRVGDEERTAYHNTHEWEPEDEEK